MKKLSVALILTTALAGSAAAGPPNLVVSRDLNVPTATVLVSPADFASSHARTMLDRRIRGAIETVCGSYATIETDQQLGMDLCWTDARAQADRQLERAMAQGGARVMISAR